MSKEERREFRGLMSYYLIQIGLVNIIVVMKTHLETRSNVVGKYYSYVREKIGMESWESVSGSRSLLVFKQNQCPFCSSNEC